MQWAKHLSSPIGEATARPRTLVYPVLVRAILRLAGVRKGADDRVRMSMFY